MTLRLRLNLLTVNSRVDSQAEKVLMVWCKHAGCYDGTKGQFGLTESDGCGREDTGCPNFVVDRRILTEMEGEDVFVVAYSDDRLQYKNARACHHGMPCTEICMLPKYPVILFMQADYIWQF